MARSLIGALNTATDRVHGKSAARRTSRELVALFARGRSVVPAWATDSHHHRKSLRPQDSSGHPEFLQQHARVRFHFTPTSSPWLAHVEIWFAKIEREVIAHGIFISVSDLARKLRRYINAYSVNAWLIVEMV